MDITDFARLGGKARWKGKTKKQRSEAMKKVRNSYKHPPIDEQAR